MGKIKCGRRTIETSHEERILFPKSNISKGDIIAYYAKVAPYMLSFMKDHPLTMQRFPKSLEEGFYHKDAPSYFPSWIKTIPVEKKEGGKTNYVICNDQATLVYLANQASITYHLWLSNTHNVHNPDRLIFDLDPGKSKFENVRVSALALKEILKKLGLESFPMLTGSQGIHIVTPLNGKQTFDEVYSFAYDVATYFVHLYPKVLTLELRKNKRGRRIFVDTLRNQFTSTAVSPYSIRPIEGAPVATPIDWKEVKDSTLSPQRYTIKTVFERLKKQGDPWKNFSKKKYSLITAHKKIKQLLSEL